MSEGGKAKRFLLRNLTTHSHKHQYISSSQDSETALEQLLADNPDAISALPHAPLRFEIEANLRQRDKSIGWQRIISWLLWSFPFLQRIQQDIVQTFKTVESNPASPNQEISSQFLQQFVSLAKSYGIGAVGYTPLPQEAIFKEKAVLFDQAIVLIMEMDAAKMSQAPSRMTFRMVMETYYKLGHVVNLLVDHLRAAGFAAQAGHPLNGVTLYPIIAQSAGLGWCGSHGLIITPEFGPRHRIGIIYTNIRNLPFVNENHHSWIEELCSRCGQCIRKCPSQAIYEVPIRRPYGIVTHIDVEQCFPIFAAQYGCSICIKVCPFNLHSYEKIKIGFLKGAKIKSAIDMFSGNG